LKQLRNRDRVCEKKQTSKSRIFLRDLVMSTTKRLYLVGVDSELQSKTIQSEWSIIVKSLHMYL
jgi:hypothetical protein